MLAQQRRVAPEAPHSQTKRVVHVAAKNINDASTVDLVLSTSLFGVAYLRNSIARKLEELIALSSGSGILVAPSGCFMCTFALRPETTTA